MKLTEEQVTVLKNKSSEGAQLNDLQKIIQEEFQISITYMETRFLVSDYNIEIISPTKAVNETPQAPLNTTPTPEKAPANEPDAPAAGAANVQVSVDQVTAPNAVINGRVIWSDGQSASWMIDQAGGLALDPQDPSYQPSREDIEDFQAKLRQLLEA